MKCINDKCENGLWSEEGCLFPEGTRCSDFIPESEKSSVVPVESQSTGSAFNYVECSGGNYCKGWINLFFGDKIVALIDNVELANEIKKTISDRLPNVPRDSCGD